VSGALRLAILFSLLALAPAVALADPPAAYQGDPGHTGFAPGATLAPPLGKRWIRTDIGWNVSYPVVAEGKVFVTTSNGVYALDLRSGATVWTRNVDASGVAYDSGKIFVVDSHAVMQALSASSGSVLWTTSLPGGSLTRSAPTAYGGDIVYTSGSERVFGVRESDGLVLFSTITQADTNPPVVDSDRVYSVEECYASALHRTVGVAEWHYTPSCGGARNGPPVLYGGKLYIRQGRSGTVLDTLLGSVLGSFVATQPPAFAGDSGYFAADATLTAQSLSSGAATWQDNEAAPIATPPLVTGNYVFGATDDSVLGVPAKVFAIERSSGRRVWDSTVPVGAGRSWADGPFVGMAAVGNTLVLSRYGYIVAWSPGPDAPGIDSGSAPPPTTVQLRMAARPSEIVFGEQTQLSGELRGVSLGTPRDIVIRASEFPFRTWRQVALTSTDDVGDFVATVKPRRNTLYTASYAGTTPPAVSNRVPVFTSLAMLAPLWPRRTLAHETPCRGPARGEAPGSSRVRLRLPGGAKERSSPRRGSARGAARAQGSRAGPVHGAQAPSRRLLLLLPPGEARRRLRQAGSPRFGVQPPGPALTDRVEAGASTGTVKTRWPTT
jgi:outer membrane protein assembly factor BamB